MIRSIGGLTGGYRDLMMERGRFCQHVWEHETDSRGGSDPCRRRCKKCWQKQMMVQKSVANADKASNAWRNL